MRHFPPENKANLLNGGVSRVSVFNLLSLLMRCITVTGYASWAQHARGPFNTVQYENIDHWCCSVIDKWGGTHLIHGAIKHTLSFYSDNKVWTVISHEPNQGVSAQMLPHTHAYHLNESGRMLSVRIHLILCLSRLLFTPGLWQLIISVSAHLGWWISHTSIMLTQTCFVRGLFPRMLFN